MLDLARTRISDSRNINLHPSYSASVLEGMMLQSVNYNGVGSGRPSNGGTSEVYCGVALSPYRKLSVVQRFEVVGPIAADALNVLLSDLAVTATDISVINVATSAALTVISTGSVASGQVKVSTVNNKTNLEFYADSEDSTYVVNYRAAANASDWNRWGVPLSSEPATDFLNVCGVIHNGTIATDCFDASANWLTAGAGGLKMIAGGLLAPAGSAKSGTAIGNSVLVQAPTADYPFLVFDLI